MQQGVLIVGAQGEIAYANQRIAAILGLNRERLVGTLLHKLVRSADEAGLSSVLNAQQGTSAQAEVRLRRADNEYVTTLVTVTAIADGQKMCLVSDLSLQKRHEAADERTRKFLATMAHEFRNILSPIKNASEALRRYPGMPAESGPALDIIDRQLARMVNLVEDLRRINPQD
jgi:PAS domain S-box-containing protein